MTPQIHPATVASLQLEHEFFQNPRFESGLQDESIAELADDIASNKKRTGSTMTAIELPLKIVAAKQPDGTVSLVVFDGQRRTLAAREAFRPSDEIPVVYMTEKPVELTRELADELYLRVLSIGTHREGLSSVELSEAAERLKNRGWTLDKIAPRIKKSESWISRMLSARKNATPDVLKAWKAGKLTDERFKDLAAAKPEAQSSHLDSVVTAQNGTREEKAEARARAKEVRETESAKPKPAPTPKKEKPAQPSSEAPKTVSKHELEGMLEMAKRKPPTDPYVKGVFDAIRYALGHISADDLARPWGVYVARLDGKPRPAKPVKSAKKTAKRGTKKK